jgi:sortase A
MPRRNSLIQGILTGALVGALAGLVWIFGPSLWLEISYQFRPRQTKVEKADSMIAAPTNPVSGFGSLFYSINQGFSAISEGAEVMIAPMSTDFGVVIPKIMANVAVTADVNPAKPEVYQEVLRTAGGVAHAAGSAYPDEDGAVYIFGHSTDSNVNVARYNAVFYLLRKLEPNDLIVVYFRGKDYRYRVKYKKVVNPDDLNDITSVANERKLILQTCWPPGTTWKRLLVVAEPEAV